MREREHIVSDQSVLTIAYSTLADRISNIKSPHLEFQHNLLVLVQNPQQIPYQKPNFICRLIESDNMGVAKSRNLAIDNCDSKYLLFADDDVIFSVKAITELIDYFETHKNCDLILTQTKDTKGNLRKKYPLNKQKLTHFNSAKAATYEIMVRTSSIREKKIRFDENFGAGVANFLGDEYIFITDLIKAKGKGVFLPITLATHPVESSGSHWGSDSDTYARSAVFARVFGVWAPIIRIAFLLRTNRKNVGFKNFLKFVIGLK